MQTPWRNGLACWTSNSKVVGSSPTGGGMFPFLTNIPNGGFKLMFTSLVKCECISQAISWNCKTRKVIPIPFAPVRVRWFLHFLRNKNATVYNGFVTLENLKVFKTVLQFSQSTC